MRRIPCRVAVVMLGALLPLATAGQALASDGSSQVFGTSEPSALSSADVARLSAGPTERSIIVMRDQHPDLPARGSTAGARTAAVESDQKRVKDELAQLSAPARSFHVVNAVSATISKAEADRLASNPAVQAVVPDLPVQRQPVEQPASIQAAAPAAATAGAAPQQVCPSDPAVPLLEPEALQLTNTEFQPGSGQPAAHDLASGTGVKVAFIADGLDIQNPDLQRGGRSIVFDYQDFSGDGLAAPTGGGEAFGDAASIAAQGSQVYDISQFTSPAHPLPPGCTIRIKGVAPGVTLAALKVFGTAGAFASTVIQAIDWAVERDHVDVINESFGANPFPDTRNDPIQLANENAVAAGVTVVASSGDAGFTNTIGDSADSSHVISVGGTTQLRLYRQLTEFGSQISPGGWVNNNPSALSSSGFTQFGPRTIDLMAPGDLGWSICSTNVAVYQNCFDNAGRPANIQVFGGTSESSPLVAGEAALVIEAFRRAHAGASPGPDLVKRLLTSTASDLGIPAQEQGAGLADALKAVQAALSVRDAGATPKAQGSSLLLSQSRLSATAPAGRRQTFHVQVTNTGAAAQRVTPSVRRLSNDPLSSDTGTLALTPATAPVFVDSVGRRSSFALHQFSVPAGAQRLDADISWAAQSQPASTVRLTLFDPLGRLVVYSLPQGAASGFGHVDVHDPSPGAWTAVIWTIDNASVYSGDVQFSFTTERFQPFGQVSPSSRLIRPGETASFEVRVTTPAEPGDAAANLVFDSGGDTRSSIPITLRSLVPTGASGGSFSGVLEGGNGRSAVNAQMFSFQFDVPRERPSLNLGLTLRDPNYRLTGFLVDPSGESLDVQSTAVLDAAGRVASFGNLMQFFEQNPRSGRWTAVLRLARGIDGAHLREPFTGRLSFNASHAATSGVPNSRSTVLPAGRPVTATVTVTNTGLTTKQFFADPRLVRRELQALLTAGATNVPLPLSLVRTPPLFAVPTDTSRLVVVAQGTVPIVMDTRTQFGGSDRLGVSVPGNFSVATDAAPEVAPGAWFALPEEQGPFDPVAGAPAATANVAAFAEARVFDPAVGSSTGDVWRQTVDATAGFTPLTLAPGASGTITVVITPNAPAGTVVRGSLEIDTFNPVTLSGDQVVSVPYSYRVG